MGIRQGIFFTKSLYSVLFGENERRCSDSLYSVESVGSWGRRGYKGVGGEREGFGERGKVAVASARQKDVPKILEMRYENIENLEGY